MQLAWVEDFLALARLGSFTRAAEARGVAQSALSRRVRALEHWAGAALFDRASHPVALTDAGRLLLPVAERVLRELAGVREQARATGSTQAVVVAAPHSAAIGLLPGLLGPVGGKAAAPPGPLLRVEADDAEGIARRLREGACHLGLLYVAADPPPPNVGALPAAEVVHDRLLPVTTPDGGGAPRHALPGRPGAPARWLSLGAGTYIGQAVAAARRGHFPPHHLRVVAENGLAAALRTLALGGVGLAWLPESLVADDLAAGALVRAGAETWDVPLRVLLVRSAAPSAAADRLFGRCTFGLPDTVARSELTPLRDPGAHDGED